MHSSLAFIAQTFRPPPHPLPSGHPSPLGTSFGSLKRRYTCLKCPYSTDRRDLFTRHENIHRDEKPFRCYVCEKHFNRADHVKKHFLRIHKGVEYDVKLTKRVKGRDYDVRNETMDKTVKREVLEQLVEKELKETNVSANPLLSELLMKKKESEDKDEKEEDFQCEFCGCTFADEISLERHRFLLHRYLLETQTDFPFKCSVCGIKTLNSSAIMAHMTQHVTRVQHVSQQAEKESADFQALDKNCGKKKLKSNSRRKQREPKKIVKFFSDFKEFCSETESFQCKLCYKDFSTFTQLIQHKKTVKH